MVAWTMTPLEDGIRRISGEASIWIRAAAVRSPDGEWHVRLLELTSGAAPPSWCELVREYPDVLFVGTTQDGAVVGKELEAGKLAIADCEIVLPQLLQSLRWERQRSHWAGACEPLEWPTLEAHLAERTSHAEPHEILVSEKGAPSFLSYYAAGACFFWADHSPVGGSLYQGVVYRHQDTRGRLAGIRVGIDAVEVKVDGHAIGGMVVELAGDTPGPYERLQGDASIQIVTFPLKDGLPVGTWVILRSGGEWIDKRHLSVPWSQGAETGVEFLVEPGTRLEVFLANREGPQVEFKRQLPTNNESKTNAMKTVCAFANGEGGSILFGVDNEAGLVGLSLETLAQAKDDLTRMMGAWIEPGPPFDFDVLPITGSDQVVLELKVAAGPALYGCGRLGDVRIVYRRHYATTVPARPLEIAEIARSRAAPHRSSGPLASLMDPASLLDDGLPR